MQSQDAVLPEAAPRRAFIPELHGLRGLALLLVVAFHLFSGGRVSGGIDIFLVISGFLFTGSLARQAIGEGRINFVRHYARVGSRLLPAALVTLAGVALAMVLFLPQNHWIGTLQQLLACTLFMENWSLISSHADYAAAGGGSSPVQHFWSLAIQGQFYLVWPWIILAVVLAGRILCRRFARSSWPSPLNLLTIVTAVASAVSLGYATWLGTQDQIVSYFHTGTRSWELGAGALLALTASRLPSHPKVKLAAGWLGLALVVSSGFVLDGAKLFPGPAALWPVGGALLILYGSGAGHRSVAAILEFKPLHKLADISYPLYLWHWPVAVFSMRVFGWTKLSVPQAVAVLSLSLVLAWLTQRLIAAPVMAWVGRINPWKALAATLAMVCFSTISLAGANAATTSRIEAALFETTVRSAEHPGALVLDSEYGGKKSGFTEPFVPDTMVADQDRPEQFTNGCMQEHVDAEVFSDVRICDPVGAVGNPKRTIVVTGGSHALQWMPALEQLGKQLDWSFIAIVKAGCFYFGAGTLEAPDAVSNQSCIEWNAAAEQVILDLHPDAVFTLGTKTVVGELETLYGPSILGWERLSAAGIPVLAMRDTPRYDTSRPECVEQSAMAEECSMPRDFIYQAKNPLTQFPGIPDSVIPLDVTADICPAGTCSPIIGNVLVYWDDDHLNRTYVQTLAPALLDELERRASFLF
jgi:peptidoglycan/LPS O-acetylase OafA/YrhL